jgi:hypothetical protein
MLSWFLGDDLRKRRRTRGGLDGGLGAGGLGRSSWAVVSICIYVFDRSLGFGCVRADKWMKLVRCVWGEHAARYIHLSSAGFEQ